MTSLRRPLAAGAQALDGLVVLPRTLP